MNSVNAEGAASPRRQPGGAKHVREQLLELLLSQAEAIDKAISRHRVDVAHDKVGAIRAQRIAKLIERSIDLVAGQLPERTLVREVGEDYLERWLFVEHTVVNIAYLFNNTIQGDTDASI